MFAKIHQSNTSFAKKMNNKTSKNNWHFLLATAAVLQSERSAQTKYLLTLRPRQQQMGILVIMMMRSDKWAVVTPEELNCQNIGGWGPHWGSPANQRPGSESADQSEASTECSLAAAPSQYFIAETWVRDITTVATREPAERGNNILKGNLDQGPFI